MFAHWISRGRMLALIAMVMFDVAAMPATQPAAAHAKTVHVAATQPASAPATQAAKVFAIPIGEQTVSGNVVSFPGGSYDGKLVLINFWASWCPHCGQELSFWKDAYAKYHSRGLEIIGVSTDKDKKRTIEQLKTFLAQKKMTWEQVYENGPQISRFYQVDSLPMSLLADGTTGEVFVRGQALRRGGLARQIEAHLKKPQMAHVPTTRPHS